MEALPQQFSDAVRNVRVSDEKLARTIDAHSEVRSILESDSELCEWGIDTILIGSYRNLSTCLRHRSAEFTE
jgi:hypothetical protein